MRSGLFLRHRCLQFGVSNSLHAMKEANISLPACAPKMQGKPAIVQKNFFLFGSANSPDTG